MILSKGKIQEINIEEFILSKITSDALNTILLIVPTNRRLRDLKKKIINNFPNKPISIINLETFSTFCTKILQEHKSFTQISEATSSVLIKKAAEKIRLKYFSAYSKGIPFGTLDKIKNVISEYKKHGISPNVLNRESEKLEGGERNKAIDIANIYKTYLENCQEISALEIGDIYSALLEINKTQFSEYLFENYNDIETIILDGFDEFSQLEIKILNYISESTNLDILINFDFYKNNDELFAHLIDTNNRLQENGFVQIIDKTPSDNFGFKNIIRNKLCKELIEPANSKFKEKLFKAKVNSRIEEIDLIAKKIKFQILAEKIAPEKICVAFNVISNYSNLVRDIFKKYGIPINLTDRIPIKTSPPVVAAISLLELVENDFYYYDLMRVLSNGFFEFAEIDKNNLMKVASELKIKKGLYNWKSTLHDAINILPYSDKNFNEKIKQEKNYKKALKDISHLENLLLPFYKKLDHNDFLENLKNVLHKLKLPYLVIEDSNSKEEEFIKATVVMLQTLNEVLLLLKDETNTKQSLSYYIDHLRTISNWARFNVKENSDQGVLVTSVNEIRGLQFDYLFLGGMCDGDFPTKYSPEIFVSGSFRRKELMHQTEERYHFYQALSSWNKKLFLTIPMNDSNSELVESTFIKDLEKVFEFSNFDLTQHNFIFSKEELQIKFAEDNSNPILQKAASETFGNYHKIISKNEIRKNRVENPFGQNSFNGFINHEDNQNDYLEKFSDKEFSITQLEVFAKCPFKYFAERILNLSTIEEPTDEAEPIELGNVLHSILFEFYSKIVNEKLTLDKPGTNNFEKLKNILFEIAEEKITKLNLNSPIAFFEKEKILGIEGEKENSILYQFLLTETKEEKQVVPQYFEINFGGYQQENESNIPPLQIENLKLRGKIDRIDVDEENKLFNVIDYKLKGAKPSAKDLFDGVSLQLPVYLLAGKHILKEINDKDFEGNDMTIYSLHYKDKSFGPNNVNLTSKRKLEFDEKISANNELLENTKNKLLEYHNKIKDGEFNLSQLEDREEKVCKYCDFRSFCRVQEVFET